MTNWIRCSVIAVTVCFVGTGYAQTVDVPLAEHQSARATVISPNVFCISVSLDGPAEARKSLYLDPQFAASKASAETGKLSTSNGLQSLTTDVGALQIDAHARTWSLLGADGKVITPAVAFMKELSRNGRSEIALPIGWPADQPFLVYGGGSGPEDTSLRRETIVPHVGNGEAIEPFFYSPLGFATFAVSDDDDVPMRCDGRVDGDVTWHAPGKHADLYVIIAPNFDTATTAYNTLIGKPPVPPMWAFGYLQSRWGWKDKAYIDDTLKQFTDRKLPVDGFIFDFEWYTTFPDYAVKPEGTADFSDFTFNPALFPEPEKQIEALHDAGLHVIGIRKPRMGNTATLNMLRDKGWLTSHGPREQFESRNLKWSLPEAKDWYARQTEPLLKAGIDAWWDDEGELTYETYQNWNEAEIDALKAVRPNGRHWSVDRAFSPGVQRTGAAAWTGDIHADWQTLQRTPAELLNWSMSGMTYSACDIGGFSGEENPELLSRWMEAGVFFPVMRSHSDFSVKPHFPWLFGEDAENAMRKALDLRYQLVPMLYSLAHVAHETGVPIMRPMVAEFPNDAECVDLSSQWMVGRLMCAPILTESHKRKVYLPAGDWFNFATNEKLTGPKSVDVDAPLDSIPLYVRAGTILPLGPVVMHTRDCTTQPLDVRIYPGSDATFTLVEDDGETTAYLDGKSVRRTTFAWDDAKKTLSWKITGDYRDRVSQKMSINVIGSTKPATETSLEADGSAGF